MRAMLLPTRIRRSFFPILGLLAIGVASCSPSDATAPGAAWSVEFSAPTLTITTINAAQSVTATIRDVKGTSIADASISWSSENPSVADVTGGGRTVSIIARSPGSTNIRATSGSAQATLIVTVLGVRNVQLNPLNVALRIGETQTFNANVNADPGVPTGIQWSSSNNAIATVNANGVVTAVAPGNAIISAAAVADPRYVATAQVAVAPVRGIVLAPTSLSLATGQQSTLSASVSLPSGQSTAVTWRSDNSTVATVNAQGVVTAVAVGNATITAEAVGDHTLQATAFIRVDPSIRSVAVNPTSAQLNIGATQPLVATVTADGGLAQTVTWRTSNPAIATVDGNGLVTAVALGNANITVLSTVDTTKRATASIAIAPRPITVSITQREVALAPGNTAQLSTSVSADPGVSTAVSWSSSAAAVATVSNSGLVTALAAGTTLITATSQVDPTKKDTVTVAVSGRLATSWTATRLGGALYEDVQSIYVAADNNVFAINSVGNIYRYNGTSWSLSLAGDVNGTRFNSVHGTSATNIFAVGTGGRVFRWQGSSWTQMTSGSAADLNAVYAIADNNVIAVGVGGAALHYNGSTWTARSTATSETLNAVWGVGSIAYAAGTNGVMARFNGTQWAVQSTPTTETLHALTGFDVNTVYAVGDFGTLLFNNGSQWTAFDSGVTVDLLGLAAGTANVAYATGASGTVLRVSGSSVTTLTTPYPARLISAAVASDGTVWAAGQRGIVEKLQTSQWSTINLAPDLLDVWSTAANSSWAVGEFGFIYRWNGTTWTRQDAPTRERLNTVWASSASDAFVGGDGGVMLHWNGSAWFAMPLPVTSDVMSLWGSSANDVYATTYNGEILRYNGIAWSIVHTQDTPLWGLYGSGANNVFAVGEQGKVVRYNGTQWAALTVTASPFLVGIWTSGAAQAISVGQAPNSFGVGAAYIFNGTVWQESGTGTQRPEMTSVWGVNVNDLYASSDMGQIQRFNGTAWSSMTTGTSEYLWSVTGSPNGVGGAFAVGWNSTMVTGTVGIGLVTSPMIVGSTRSFDPSPRSRPARATLSLPDGAARRSHARSSMMRAHR